mgnify:CR=1 FL=1
MNTEEFDITDGKKLLYLVFGANRWEFERIEEGTMEIPIEAQGCLERIRSTIFYLLKNWKNIAADDRAMGEAGLTQEIAEVKTFGFSIKGIKSYGYGRAAGEGDARKYTAYLRILKDG